MCRLIIAGESDYTLLPLPSQLSAVEYVAVGIFEPRDLHAAFVGSGVLRPIDIDGGAAASEDDQLVPFTTDRP